LSVGYTMKPAKSALEKASDLATSKSPTAKPMTVAPNRRPSVPRHYLRRVDIGKTLQVLSIVNIRSTAMTNPVRASNTHFAIKVEQGKDYWWCACGQSKKQPFCDGTHKGSTFSPVKYSPDVSKEVHFCGCKGTASQPLCDGSHKEPV